MALNAIVVDLDSTIADTQHRDHLFESDRDEYWQQCINDTPILPVVCTVRAYHEAGYELWILTARSDIVKAKTVDWLSQHNVPYHHLVMRPDGDDTKDFELKRRWMAEYNLAERLLLVLEDRDQVVEMWREEGIPCFQVQESRY